MIMLSAFRGTKNNVELDVLVYLLLLELHYACCLFSTCCYSMTWTIWPSLWCALYFSSVYSNDR